MDSSTTSRSKGVNGTHLAAVLILLFEQEGSLWVLLTTRSKHLRSHPGQTALPGGKVDPGEKDPFTTARREAFEECGLPLSHPAIQDITLLPPFLSQYKLIVTPCVSLLTDLHVLDTLIPNVGEVDHCFFHPLAAVLDPSVMIEETVADKGSEDWPYEEEHHNTSDRAWLWDSVYRMHRFRSSHTPVKGLTADILLLTAEIAYHRKPVFQRYAPNQVIP
ncbi:hypothetical protein DACRYDRAFT_93283 [Dacryopinax primogenitus]|uniref:Nudix hydrolase domain-containing protein n=1 Tax=Dacryopinax primogenitus (strain DJM 731) TaxID=1858805 RepID=M5G9E7_DACPD|nr:uncharacterized protein DACRYDRAFT_93283 [Dacryopinax primogenitus]EJU04860.1 hypothetical protein DACRYDRAFT_93283 [Dacryopinax primogenitus]